MVAVLPVTSLYAGIHAAFFAVLSLRVAMFRGSAMKEGKQAESMPEFKLCNSAQSNFGQYLPVVFLLFGLLEANGVLSQRYLYIVGAAITVARVGHALQLSAPKTIPIGFRMFGMMATMAFFVFAGVLCAIVGLQETGYVDKNLLGNNRTWLGFADEKYHQATDTIKQKASEL